MKFFKANGIDPEATVQSMRSIAPFLLVIDCLAVWHKIPGIMFFSEQTSQTMINKQNSLYINKNQLKHRQGYSVIMVLALCLRYQA